MKVTNQYKHSFIILELLTSLFFLGTMIFLIILLRDNQNPDNLQNLQYNWNQRPVMDIVALDMDSECPTEYENLFYITYPGISGGCQCNGTALNSTKGSMCSFDQIYNGCRNLFSKGSSIITNYKNKTLCVKRMNESYLGLRDKVFNSSEVCPNNTKRCGRFDSLENDLCLPENECPITEIIATNKESPTYAGYNKIILKENVNGNKELYRDSFWYFSNKNYKKMYSSIILTGGKDYLCASQDFRNYLTFKDCPYNKFFNPKSEICSLKDDNYGTYIDKVSGYQFYSNNDITSEYFRDIYDCNENAKFEDKYLYSSNYHGINKSCDPAKTEEFVKIVMNRTTVRGNLLAFLEIFRLMLIFFYFLLSLIGKWHFLIKYHFRKIKTVYFFEISTFVLFFFISGYVFIEYLLLYFEVNYVIYFRDNSCGDTYSNDLASQLSTYNEKTIGDLLLAFIFIMVGSLVNLSKFIYFYCKFSKANEASGQLAENLNKSDNDLFVEVE